MFIALKTKPVNANSIAHQLDRPYKVNVVIMNCGDRSVREIGQEQCHSSLHWNKKFYYYNYIRTDNTVLRPMQM